MHGTAPTSVCRQSVFLSVVTLHPLLTRLHASHPVLYMEHVLLLQEQQMFLVSQSLHYIADTAQAPYSECNTCVHIFIGNSVGSIVCTCTHTQCANLNLPQSYHFHLLLVPHPPWSCTHSPSPPSLYSQPTYVLPCRTSWNTQRTRQTQMWDQPTQLHPHSR